MWLAAAQALAVAYVPGALAYRLPYGNRPQRARAAVEERVFWGVMLSAMLTLGTVLALALVGRYSFNAVLTVDLSVSALMLIGWRGGLGYGGQAARPSWSALLPLALIAAGLWLYFPPSEYVVGGKDPGIYVNEGVQIGQRGSVIIHDPVVASVPVPFRELFFRNDNQPTYYGPRFMGFFVQHLEDGSVVGQFPHLFPASIAVGYALNGLSGARQAVGVWAILGLLAVYFAGAHLFGRLPAFAAVALLTINVAEVWFARYPNTEVMMQAMLFAAFLAFARAQEESRGFFGTVAGVLLGGMLFLRYDAVLAFGSFAAAATVVRVSHRRLGASFAVFTTMVAVAGFFYLTGPMRAYAAYPLAFTRDSGGIYLLTGAVVLALGIHQFLRREWFASSVRRFLPPVLAIGLVALATYAYFYRQPGGGTADGDAMAFRTFGWYVGPWVQGAMVVAVALLVTTQFWRSPVFFLTLSLFSLFFFYKSRIVPEHFWAARRFLPVTLPGALVCLAAAVDVLVGERRVVSLLAWLTRNRSQANRRDSRIAAVVGPALVAAALAPLGWTFWRASEPVRHHVEYAGLIPELEQLIGRIGPRDLLLLESRNAGSDLHVFGQPLAYIYAKNVLVLESPVPPKRLLEEFLTWARTHYDNVLFLGGGGTDLLTRRIAAVPIVNDHFQVPEYGALLNQYPTSLRQKEFEYGLYRLVAAADGPATPIDLQIGALDDLNVVRFHARERRADGTQFRWTQAQSFVLLLGMPAKATTLTLWLSSGGRPPQAAPPTVEVALDDRVIGTATPIDETRPYSFPIPPDIVAAATSMADPLRMRLRVATWSPAEILGGNDTRQMGVIVTRVQVR